MRWGTLATQALLIGALAAPTNAQLPAQEGIPVDSIEARALRVVPLRSERRKEQFRDGILQAYGFFQTALGVQPAGEPDIVDTYQEWLSRLKEIADATGDAGMYSVYLRDVVEPTLYSGLGAFTLVGLSQPLFFIKPSSVEDATATGFHEGGHVALIDLRRRWGGSTADPIATRRTDEGILMTLTVQFDQERRFPNRSPAQIRAYVDNRSRQMADSIAGVPGMEYQRDTYFQPALIASRTFNEFPFSQALFLMMQQPITDRYLGDENGYIERLGRLHEYFTSVGVFSQPGWEHKAYTFGN